jgi:hypothetical protein
MKQSTKDWLTPRGLFGAVFFVVVGISYLYTERSRIDVFETIISFCSLFILAPYACLRIYRRQGPAIPAATTGNAVPL